MKRKGYDNFILTQNYESPLGTLILGDYNGKLCMCDWSDSRMHAVVENRLRRLLKAEFIKMPSDITQVASRQMDEYFSTGQRNFQLPMLLVGTPFQISVWNYLSELKGPTTVTYSGIARQIGRASSVRAVANAVGSNPLSIIIPCHLVIGSDGSLTGYAGGLDRKRRLLTLESSEI